jgi:hypothetical protein
MSSEPLSSIVGSDYAIEKGKLTLFPPGRGTRLLRSFALLSSTLLFAAPTHIVGQADPSTISASPEQEYLWKSSSAMVDRLDPQFNLVVTHDVHLLTYRQLIAIQGLQSKQRPPG